METGEPNRLRLLDARHEKVIPFDSGSVWRRGLTMELEGFGYKARVEKKKTGVGWHAFASLISYGTKRLGSPLRLGLDLVALMKKDTWKSLYIGFLYCVTF